jgi:hypothetical protein
LPCLPLRCIQQHGVQVNGLSRGVEIRGFPCVRTCLSFVLAFGELNPRQAFPGVLHPSVIKEHIIEEVLFIVIQHGSVFFTLLESLYLIAVCAHDVCDDMHFFLFDPLEMLLHLEQGFEELALFRFEIKIIYIYFPEILRMRLIVLVVLCVVPLRSLFPFHHVNLDLRLLLSIDELDQHEKVFLESLLECLLIVQVPALHARIVHFEQTE